MRLTRAGMLGGVALALCFGVRATVASAQISEDECLRLHPGIRSPVEIATCISDAEAAKHRLDTAYAALKKQVAPDHRSMLRKAQKAWLAFRSAQCTYDAGGYRGSTMNSSDIIACTAAMNVARAAELEDDLARWQK